MIGYSDSNKDAGIFMSSFALYRAQQRLVEVGKRNDLRLKIFHGRGGSIGRGGGPSQRAIESLPTGSIDGRFKLTEQGEVLGWKYLLPEIAERNLEITASGVLGASLDAPVDSRRVRGGVRGRRADEPRGLPRARRRPVVRRVLRGVDAPRGDRAPQHRLSPGAPDREEAALARGPARDPVGLRVDAVTADGAGLVRRGARAPAPHRHAAALELVRRMHAEWPFFASTLDAVAVSLATADMDIARRYASLARDRWRARRLFFKIALDHGRAERALMLIFDRATVLAPSSTLARSIELRNPYVDPLSFIQLELLRRKRALVAEGREVPHELDRALLLTINGIAAGLRNTG